MATTLTCALCGAEAPTVELTDADGATFTTLDTAGFVSHTAEAGLQRVECRACHADVLARLARNDRLVTRFATMKAPEQEGVLQAMADRDVDIALRGRARLDVDDATLAVVEGIFDRVQGG